MAHGHDAFRAGRYLFWRRKGVDEAAMDALVAHHAHSTRERHYAGPEELMEQMREAVALLSPIDWAGPKGKETVVRLQRT